MSGTRSRLLAGVVVVSLAVAAVSAAPLLAQDDGEMDAVVVDVQGGDYFYANLNTSLPVGTDLSFTNNGTELHELAVARVADDVELSTQELLAMGEAALEEGLVEIVGEGPIFAVPGMTADGTLALDREGRYVAVCFINQGFTEEIMALIPPGFEFGPDSDPSTLPEAVQAVFANPPHLALGMVQEFTVTAAGTEPGPLPDAGESMDEGEAMDDGETIEQSSAYE